MREYDIIDASEGIDVNKTNASKEFVFAIVGFKYEPYLYNGCHDLMQEAMRFNDVPVAYVKGSDYRIHFSYLSKNDAISIMNNSKKGVL